MSIIQSSLIPSTGGDFTVDQSLRFTDTAKNGTGSFLSRKPPLEGNRKRWTYSCWTKGLPAPNANSHESQILLSADGGTNHYLWLAISNDGTLDFRQFDNSSGYYWRKISTALFRDPSAWYHFLVVYDSANGTAEDRIKMYVNGERITSFGTNTNPNQNTNSFVNDDDKFHSIGRFSYSGAVQTDGALNGYLGEVNFIDGLVKVPTDFGETGTYGEWKPIKYSGSYGTNGFYLPFKQDYTVEGFSATIYTGTGNGDVPRYIGGIGFQPDLIWWKQRYRQSGNADGHLLMDSVRGTGTGKWLSSDQTGAEGIYSTNANITSLDTDGFTIGATSGGNALNGTGYACVAWCWDMGGSNANNTTGNINSVVRANPAYGQSIVSYTGNGSNNQTVGHGLSSAPEMIIYKDRENANNDWKVYHLTTGNAKDLRLNDTAGANNSTAWGSTTPTSSVFTVNGSNTTNINNNDSIAYCFHSVSGYSKFSYYTGTGGSQTLTFGFRPAFIMIKKSSGAGNGWMMLDTTRTPVVLTAYLEANSSGNEGDGANFGTVTDTGFNLTATYGSVNSNGATYIYMAFADKREYAYWLDQSGNNNDWTSHSLTESDVMVDSPTNNFCTLNPLNQDTEALEEGNLQIKSRVGGSGTGVGRGTIGFSSGKWYAEYLYVSGANGAMAGISPTSVNMTVSTGNYYAFHNGHKVRYIGNTYTDDGSLGATFSAGDILGIAMDADNNTIAFYKNNVLQGGGNAYTGLTDEYTFSQATAGGAQNIGVWNFGQDSSFASNKTAQGNQDGNDIGDFYYEPQNGFLTLCSANLSEPTVVPSENFNTVLYTGNATNRNITDVGFAPSLTWLKARSIAYGHRLIDTVRGAPNVIASQSTSAENTSETTGLTAFRTDGFTLGTSDGINKNGDTFVAWNWKANGSGSTNTNGSINTTVSANVNAGFSIVKIPTSTSEQTVGHGLSKAPELVITKPLGATANWDTWHKDFTDYQGIRLNTSGAKYTNGGYRTIYSAGNSTMGAGLQIISQNDYGSGQYVLAYCFHSVDGYSKVGSYTGNGNADGTFVSTSFAPAFVMAKVTGLDESWRMVDSKRGAYNVVDEILYPNTSGAEAHSDDIDLLSNGFKLRKDDYGWNTSGYTYIYIAFAESPFKHSNAR